MTKVLVMTTCDEKSKQILESAGNDIEYTYIDKKSSSDIVRKHIKSAEIVIGEPEIEDILSSESIKLLQLPMAGTDKYTTADNFPSDVILTNASGAFGGVISQYVIGGILNICHKFHTYRDLQKKSLWHDEGSEIFLEGKRVLIIGTGDIGSNIAKKLSVFDTYTVGIRRDASVIPPYFNEMYTLDDLDSQLPFADVVVCCIPKSDYTYHLLDERRLMLMKKDAILVNVGRGTLIVQNDLVKVMNNGHLSGAVLDVTDPEPLPEDNPLWKVENILITPHISGKSFGHTREITDIIFKISAENIRNYIDGKPLRNVIDFKKFKK